MKKSVEERINLCFKSNDIRCIYKKELDEEIVYRTARGIVQVLNCREILLGRDMRSSSDSLAKAFIKGARDQGADVIDLGKIDTPGLYFSSGFLKKAGAMITASHNPLDYNGIKVVRPGAIPVDLNTGLEKVKELALKNSFRSKKKGKLKKKNIFKDYRKHALSFINKKNLRKVRVVIDAGNGMAGKIVPIIYKDLPIKIIPLDFKLRKDYPMDAANPAVYKNLKDIAALIRKKKADFGMAFDSDMDRVFILDEKGKILESSVTGALIIKDFVSKKVCTDVVYSLIVSKIIPEMVKKYCGKAIRSKVGHAYIKSIMKKTGAFFALERSGHFYYNKNYGADSGLITSLIIYELFSKQNKTMSELVKEFRIFSKIEEQSLKVKDSKKLMSKIKNAYKSKAKKIDNFDGLTMEFKDFWFNLRDSHTEAVLRVNLEANTKAIRDRETKKLLKLIKRN